LLKALAHEGYKIPTPIQEQAIPIILDRKDLLGCAQTGTGKTAAFALPLLQLLSEDAAGEQAGTARRPIRALILTPTRELAIQIDESFGAYGKFTGINHLVIYGGVPQNPQVQGLRRGTDILVATPGRLLDLSDQKLLDLRDIRYFVLDEADRMLDMGFINDVRKILTKLPQKKHSLFFSATMPPEIQKLAGSILVNPAKVEVTPPTTTAETVNQSIYFVDKKDKRSLLLHILKDDSIPTALVFTRTKHGADKVAQGLTRAGIRAEAIHGNKSQNARQQALTNFKNRRTRILVATDIAARGIDIDELTHVINYELPNVPETYIHRIGRTGRAGASGIALSFCDAEEKEFLRDIQKLIERRIPVVEDHPHAMDPSMAAVTLATPPSRAISTGQTGRNDRGRQQEGRRRNEGRERSEGRERNDARERNDGRERKEGHQRKEGGEGRERTNGHQRMEGPQRKEGLESNGGRGRNDGHQRRNGQQQPAVLQQPENQPANGNPVHNGHQEEAKRAVAGSNGRPEESRKSATGSNARPEEAKRVVASSSARPEEAKKPATGSNGRPEQPKRRRVVGELKPPAPGKEYKDPMEDIDLKVNQSAGDEKW
jgi:ATP-dependent RNA helicase RhlE